jgi:hypothetical protein
LVILEHSYLHHNQRILGVKNYFQYHLHYMYLIGGRESISKGLQIICVY